MNSNKLYQILLDIFGQEYEVRNGQFRINCINPDCDDTGGNLEINLEKGLFHCWKCHYGKGKKIRHLLKDFLGWSPNVDEYVSPSDLQNLGEELFSEEEKKVTEFKGLPKEYVFLGGSDLSYVGKKALKYALSRVSQDDIIKYHVGYCGLGIYKWRLIIPAFEDGKATYFVSRAFMAGVEPPYRNPDEEECGIGKSEVVFNIDGAREQGMAVVCEGVFDAMRVGKAGVAIFGTSISDTQVLKLLSPPLIKEFCVMLDQDAIKSAVKIAGLLKSYRPSVKLVIPPSGDPGSWPSEDIWSWINNAQPYSVFGGLV
jgi:hypothetical protein